jgi:CO/xanthine dehydrogenase FAD-binding subunit
MDLNTIVEVVQPSSRDALPMWQEGDAWLAGGTSLFSEPQPCLRRLVDLMTLGWPAVEADERGLRIAATCTIAQIEAISLPLEWTAASLIGQCCRAFVASFKVWNTATVGGNICMALPAGPMISLMSALDGVGTVWSSDGGERRISIIDIVTGSRKNALRPGEILRQIDLPVSMFARRTAFRKISLTPLGRSAALLIGTMSPSDGAFDLTITAATSRPVRLSFPRLPEEDAFSDYMERNVPRALFFDDMHGTSLWRQQVTLVLAEEIRDELSRELTP